MIAVKVISQEDIAEIFRGNAEGIFDIIEDSFKKYLNNEIIMPDKISQIFDEKKSKSHQLYASNFN